MSVEIILHLMREKFYSLIILEWELNSQIPHLTSQQGCVNSKSYMIKGV
jgi:hypothetical protein